MLEFWIANLRLSEATFEVPSKLGSWEFGRAARYDDVLPKLEEGMCGNTYYASHSAIMSDSDDSDILTACNELIDICFVLTFISARCVTPSATTPQSELQFIQLGDEFIRARSIIGFHALQVASITDLFHDWLSTSYPAYRHRLLRLQLSHWLSGLTCFSVEDLFLSAGVQMDMVKQRECTDGGTPELTYFQGMRSASARYGIRQLGSDYRDMRNDIVHEGVLSGRNFARKSKRDCTSVVADTLNWLDDYILSVLGFCEKAEGRPRWSASEIEHNLPSVSVR